MKRLGFAPAARADLIAIYLYIAEDSPNRAETFLAELEAKAALVADQPRAYQRRDDVNRGLRAAVHGRYVIFFRELADEVRVVRVLHGAQDLGRVAEPWS
ncbi:MAG TPA: type II toxin-antitoxin system RelE/ParE family toxin [Caulobacteraceae bacterium]|jgi:toxin ParE1/3/4|nr:type II toxin-antitoxin system RelE/ParE family toxin [Caulobacteraceae bacterium]